MREVKRLFRAFCHDDQTSWSQYVPRIENILNYSHHSSTGVTPYEIIHKSLPPRAVEEIVQFPTNDRVFPYSEVIAHVESKLLINALSRKEQQRRKKVKYVNYGIGDLVLIKVHGKASALNSVTQKLMLLYTGPYRITNIKYPNVYEVSHVHTNKFKANLNANQLKLFYY